MSFRLSTRLLTCWASGHPGPAAGSSGCCGFSRGEMTPKLKAEEKPSMEEEPATADGRETLLVLVPARRRPGGGTAEEPNNSEGSRRGP